jgi:O-antigen ligase
VFIDHMFSDAADKGYFGAFLDAVRDPATPLSVKERLMLWADALTIWASHPLFGYGSAWLEQWQSRLYKVGTYNELHNGYLEIAVRYGVAGLVFYAVLFAWAARQVFLAAKAGLIDVSAWRCYISTLVFFAVTILTNSNVRLAIGESYMWFAASIGFYCFYLLQRGGIARTRTYF